MPTGAGILSTRVDDLVDAVRWLIDDPDAARQFGDAARTVARQRFGLDRFLTDWDRLLTDVLTR